jgi:hypothetical protein
MNLSRFTDALAKFNLETDSENVDAPVGFRFQGGTHSMTITGTYQEALARLGDELPLLPCPAGCECYD